MKFRYIILLSSILLFITSCSEDYKMKKDFKEAYTGIMKDADSYELVSFEIFQNPSEFSEENSRYIDENIKTITSEEYGSICEKEEIKNPKWWYTGVLVTIRGKNSYGAKVLSEHIAYYRKILGDNTLIEIDGDYVGSNRIMRSIKND